jgi:hypothetical protein
MQFMVGRRKAIASRHMRPISPPRCHPCFSFLAGLEQLDHFRIKQPTKCEREWDQTKYAAQRGQQLVDATR